MNRTINFRLNQDLRVKVEKIADDNGVKISDVARNALVKFVDDYFESLQSGNIRKENF